MIMGIETESPPIADINDEYRRVLRDRRVEQEQPLRRKNLEGDRDFSRQAGRLGRDGAKLAKALANTSHSPEAAARALQELEEILGEIKSSQRGELLSRLGETLRESDSLQARDTRIKYGPKTEDQSGIPVEEGRGRRAA